MGEQEAFYRVGFCVLTLLGPVSMSLFFRVNGRDLLIPESTLICHLSTRIVGSTKPMKKTNNIVSQQLTELPQRARLHSA
ncbi:hypothetical protein EDD16DRAFT_1545169 [Pisolithus croceorrhizus]|nr:hypothetical protein EDD16DRAFT_1545169 [Pisolithus croceorrhizus]